MGITTYGTPEEAARQDIPQQYVRVVAEALSPAGDAAVVVLDTDGHLIDSICRRVGSRWEEVQSGVASRVKTTVIGDELAVTRLLVTAPNEAVAAIVTSSGQEHRVPVQNGYVLYAEWRDLAIEPVVRFVRSDGVEVAWPSWLGSGEGPSDLGINTERYLREIAGEFRH
jgi:hypothetical protein